MKERQKLTALEYASSSRTRKSLGSDGKAKEGLCERGEKLHCGSTSLVGWADAAYGEQSTEEKRRLGYAIGLMSSSLTGPRHVRQWISIFTGKLVNSRPAAKFMPKARRGANCLR